MTTTSRDVSPTAIPSRWSRGLASHLMPAGLVAMWPLFLGAATAWVWAIRVITLAETRAMTVAAYPRLSAVHHPVPGDVLALCGLIRIIAAVFGLLCAFSSADLLWGLLMLRTPLDATGAPLGGRRTRALFMLYFVVFAALYILPAIYLADKIAPLLPWGTLR